MQVVCKFFNIKVSDIVSDKRSNNVAYPRQIAMYLCREVANMSFPSIGKDFGGRDHSTVLHAYSKLKMNMKQIRNKRFNRRYKKSLIYCRLEVIITKILQKHFKSVT